MKVAWDRLIRFIATDGRTLYGEPILPSQEFDLGTATAESDLRARVIVGDDLLDTGGTTKVSDEVVSVKKILGPLSQKDVPIIRCVGLNYAKHSKSLKIAGRIYPCRWHCQVRRSIIAMDFSFLCEKI